MATITRKTTAPTIAAHISREQPNGALTVNDSLTLVFSNGKQLTIQIGDLQPQIIADATLHGLKQKLVDAAAISRDPETGRAATVETKFSAVEDVLFRLCAGSWNKPREGGTSSGSILFQALVRLYADKKTPEQIREFLAEKSASEKAALRKNARVAAIIAEIVAEGSDESGDDLLDELEGESAE
jgi:hypothetical protein